MNCILWIVFGAHFLLILNTVNADERKAFLIRAGKARIDFPVSNGQISFAKYGQIIFNLEPSTASPIMVESSKNPGSYNFKPYHNPNMTFIPFLDPASTGDNDYILMSFNCTFPNYNTITGTAENQFYICTAELTRGNLVDAHGKSTGIVATNDNLNEVRIILYIGDMVINCGDKFQLKNPSGTEFIRNVEVVFCSERILNPDDTVAIYKFITIQTAT